jgi:hypothetical protein
LDLVHYSKGQKKIGRYIKMSGATVTLESTPTNGIAIIDMMGPVVEWLWSKFLGFIPEGHQMKPVQSERQHTMQLYLLQLIPAYLGMSLRGDHSNSYFGMENADLFYKQSYNKTKK